MRNGIKADTLTSVDIQENVKIVGKLFRLTREKFIEILKLSPFKKFEKKLRLNSEKR